MTGTNVINQSQTSAKTEKTESQMKITELVFSGCCRLHLIDLQCYYFCIYNPELSISKEERQLQTEDKTRPPLGEAIHS